MPPRCTKKRRAHISYIIPAFRTLNTTYTQQPSAFYRLSIVRICSVKRN